MDWGRSGGDLSTKIKYESVIKKPVTFKAFNCLWGVVCLYM